MAQFSNTTDKNGLMQMAELFCKLGDGDITGNTTFLKQFTNYFNLAYWEIFMALLSVDKNFKVDDFNYTDNPVAPITMVAGQADYELPVSVVGENLATLLRVRGVFYKKSGEKEPLSLMEAGDLLSETQGTPRKYELDGKTVRFECPFNAAALTEYSSTFYVDFQRVPDPFVSTDTTQQPGFMATYHDLIPLRAASWYLMPFETELSDRYKQEFYNRLEMLKRDYAAKAGEAPKRLTPAIHSNK